jgi:hypothetical protein
MQGADTVLTDADFAVIRKTLRRGHAYLRDRVLLYAIAFFGATPMVAMAIGGDALSLLLIMLGTLPFAFALRLWLNRRLTREMEWIGTRESDLFTEYRAFVEKQRRALRGLVVLFPASALVIDGIGWMVSGRGDAMTMTCRVLLVVVATLL